MIHYIIEQIEDKYDTYLSEDEVALIYEVMDVIEEGSLMRKLVGIGGKAKKYFGELGSKAKELVNKNPYTRMKNELAQEISKSLSLSEQLKNLTRGNNKLTGINREFNAMRDELINARSRNKALRMDLDGTSKALAEERRRNKALRMDLDPKK